MSQCEEKLSGFLQRYVPTHDLEQVSLFVREILELPLRAEQHPALRTARADPLAMREHIRRACTRLLSAVLAVHPVVLALDDLQWIDAASLQLIDEVLTGIQASTVDCPLLLIALGSP